MEAAWFSHLLYTIYQSFSHCPHRRSLVRVCHTFLTTPNIHHISARIVRYPLPSYGVSRFFRLSTILLATILSTLLFACSPIFCEFNPPRCILLWVLKSRLTWSMALGLLMAIFPFLIQIWGSMILLGGSQDFSYFLTMFYPFSFSCIVQQAYIISDTGYRNGTHHRSGVWSFASRS
jgi:hypothetical protein